jgi:hypothetical protein
MHLIPNQSCDRLVDERCDVTVVEAAALEVFKRARATECLVTSGLLLLSNPLLDKRATDESPYETCERVYED